MSLHKSGEDYLKAIYLLRQKNGEVRNCNSAAYFHISLYLHVTPQTCMVTAFLKIATL